MCRERINRFDRQETGKSDEADVVLRTKRGGDRKYIAKIAHPRHPSWVARGGVVGERVVMRQLRRNESGADNGACVPPVWRRVRESPLEPR